MAGEAVGYFDDPYHVAGLPAVDGPSGLRPDAVGPVRTVTNSDGSTDDVLAAQTISDIEDFWAGAFTEFGGTFTEGGGAQVSEQRLRARPKIIALAQREVEALDGEGYEAEPGGLRHRTRGDTAIGAPGAHCLGDVRTGRADPASPL